MYAVFGIQLSVLGGHLVLNFERSSVYTLNIRYVANQIARTKKWSPNPVTSEETSYVATVLKELAGFSLENL